MKKTLKDDTFIIYKNVAPPSDNYYWMHIDREEEPVPTIIMHYVQSQGSSSHSNILMDHSKWIGPVSYKVTDVISMKLWKTRPDIYNLLPIAYSFLNWRVKPF